LNLGADDNSVVDEMMSSTGSLSAGIAYDTEIPKMELLKVVDANAVKNQNNLDRIYREQAEQAAAAAKSKTETAAQKKLRLEAADAAIEKAKKEHLIKLEKDIAGIKLQKKPPLKSSWITNKMTKFGSRAMMAPVKHLVDAHLAYAMGLVSGIQDMAQTLDEEHCKFPDYYMHKTITCACGDTGVYVPFSRASLKDEGLHWCTGTLKLLDGFCRIVFVDNPYSFKDLLNLLHRNWDISAYLKCLSQLNEGSVSERQDCSHLQPRVPLLDTLPSLEVYSIAVLSRCQV
jgi:hypothetical protein